MNAPSIEQVKANMRATWMMGDFGVIAKTIYGAGEAFIERLNIPTGAHVLDVATGTGNLAIPAARKGAIVTGVDIAPNLLEQARTRAAAEGLTIQFDEGDAEALPYADASFDIVVTMFGAMFAPRPELVATELARVLKPGGKLAMANWNPDSFTGLMFKTNAKHVPPNPDIPAPVLWGDEETARRRLDPHFTQIETAHIPLEFNYPFDPAGVMIFHRQYFGPTQVAFSRLDEAGQRALAEDLTRLYEAHNVAPDPTSRTVIENQYLQVVATR